MWLCTNCVLVPHYQLIRLCNCKLGTSPECPCPLIIQALDNCQNFNLGQTNLPRMIQMQMNKEGISKLVNINFRTQFFIFQAKFWHLCWHPMWHTFTKAFVRKCKYLLLNLNIVKMVNTFVEQFILGVCTGRPEILFPEDVNRAFSLWPLEGHLIDNIYIASASKKWFLGHCP